MSGANSNVEQSFSAPLTTKQLLEPSKDQGLSCLAEVDDGFICIHIHVQSDFWTMVYIKRPSRQPGLETEMNVLKESQDSHNVSSPWCSH